MPGSGGRGVWDLGSLTGGSSHSQLICTLGVSCPWDITRNAWKLIQKNVAACCCISCKRRLVGPSQARAASEADPLICFGRRCPPFRPIFRLYQAQALDHPLGGGEASKEPSLCTQPQLPGSPGRRAWVTQPRVSHGTKGHRWSLPTPLYPARVAPAVLIPKCNLRFEILRS